MRRALPRRLLLAFCACLAACSVRGSAWAEDTFLALQSAIPGAFNYARLADIQVFLDASPTRCAVLLTDGQEIKAFQKCETITRRLAYPGLVSLPNAFGSVTVAPSFVSSLISISGGCRLNLRNGRWAPVTQPCAAVREAIIDR